MKVVIYSIEDTINEFFATQTSATRQQCDEHAVALVGGPGTASPVKIQGSFSYTVTAGGDQPKIVQFRAADSALDTNVLDLARQVYGQISPRCVPHGSLGRLSVYVMDVVPGKPYGLAESGYLVPTGPSLGSGPQHSATVADFASFFAASWNGKQNMATEAVDAMQDGYRRKLDYLSQALPARFQVNLRTAREGLHLLFAPTYPLAVNHGDLSGMNIFVDPGTGRITGIIDWAEAKTSPFGMSLWGLENVLGFMDAEGWHYLRNHEALRTLFWQTFESGTGGVLLPEDRRAIEVARMVGLFFQYAFDWASGGQEIVRETSSSFAYLDAFCATGT